MQAERDHLVQIVFPELRERLAPHRVYLEEIDLRWGITREQAENAETLDLCLRVVDECRPFFLAVIGDRYGAVLAQPANAALVSRGLGAYASASVTELEILYGALAADGPSRACFFLRDPAAVETVPRELRAVYETADPQSRAKLEDLKARIRASGAFVRDGYAARREGGRDGKFAGLEAFGTGVRDALWAAFVEELGLRPAPAPQSANVDDDDLHDHFVETRTRVFIGRNAEIERLHRFVAARDDRPCLVHGKSGYGKSALLAKFVAELRAARPQAMIIPHFIGASDASADLHALLTRLCRALLPNLSPPDSDMLDALLGRAEEIPRELPGLKLRFREFLKRARPDRETILVIDALDQLRADPGSQPLDWLPLHPGAVKIVLSCADNRGAAVMSALARRAHVDVEIEALTADERVAMVRQVPSLSAKSLDRKQVDLLATNPAAASPLFLRAALEELRTFGSYEGLTKRIQELPRPKGGIFSPRPDASDREPTRELFTQILERLERDYGAATIERMLGLVAASRRGLREPEIVALTKDLAEPEIVYAVLRQLRPYMIACRGALGFLHLDILEAVRRRYLPLLTDADLRGRHASEALQSKRHRAHLRLAEHFAATGWRAASRSEWQSIEAGRACDEAPWHYLQAEDHHAAARLLLDFDFIEAKALNDLPDLVEDFARLLRATDRVPNETAIRDKARLRDIRRLSEEDTFTYDESVRFPRRTLTMIEELLRRNLSFLMRRPELAMQCLWNDGWWFDCADGADHFDREGAFERPRDGERSISVWLETWNAARKARPDRGPFLRSLHPPPRALSDLGRTIHAPEPPVNWNRSPRLLTAVARRRLIAALVGDSRGENELRIWRVDAGEELKRLRIDEPIGNLSFSGDGAWLAVSLPGRARLYDVASGEAVWEAPAQPGSGGSPEQTRVALSADAALLALAVVGETRVRIWSVKERRSLHELVGKAPIEALEFAPGRALLTVTGMIRTESPDPAEPDLRRIVCEHSSSVFDAGAGERLFDAPVEVIRFSADGRRAMLSLPGVGMSDASANTVVQELNGPGGAIVSDGALKIGEVFAFNVDGTRIAQASGGHKEPEPQIEFVDVATGRADHVRPTQHLQHITGLAFVDAEVDEDRLEALAGADAMSLAAFDKLVNDSLEARIRGYRPAFVADPKIVSASADGAIEVLPTTVWLPPRRRTKRHRRRIEALCFSPDGRVLVSAGADATRVWRTDGVEAFPPGAGAASVAFFPGGDRFVSVSATGEVRIVSAADGSLRAETRLETHGVPASFSRVSVSHDGALVAVEDSEGAVHVLNGGDLGLVKSFADLGSVAFHPTEPLMLAHAGQVQLIDILSWEVRRTLEIEATGVVSFNGAGDCILAVDDGLKSTKVWTRDGVYRGEIDGLVDAWAFEQPDHAWRLLFPRFGLSELQIVGARLNRVAAHYPLIAWPLIAWPEHLATHPSGLIFAATCDAVLYFFELEDPPGLDFEQAAMDARVRADGAWSAGRLEEALAHLDEAVGLYVAAPRDLREKLAPELMRAGNGRAAVLTALDRIEDAVDRATLAIDVGRAYFAFDETVSAELAEMCTLQAARLDGLGRRDEALAVSADAVGYAFKACDCVAPPPLALRALVAARHGAFLASARRCEEACPILQEAEELLVRDAPDARLDLAKCLHNLVFALTELGRDREALEAAARALDVCRALYVADPAQSDDLWQVLAKRSRIAQRLGMPELQRADEEQMLVLAHALHARGGSAAAAQQILAVAGWRLAAGETENVLSLQSDALGMLRAEFAAHPDQGRFPLALCLHARGDILSDAGRNEEAVAPLAEAADLFRALAADSATALRLAQCLVRLSSISIALERSAEAATLAQEAAALLRPRLDQGDGELEQNAHLRGLIVEKLAATLRAAGRSDEAEKLQSAETGAFSGEAEPGSS